MAIALGGTVAGVSAGTISSVSISGVNTVGFLATIGDIASDSITSVTWDGSSMTKIVSVLADRYITFWRIVAPSAGVTNIVMTGGTFKRGMSGFYTGVDQISPIDSNNTGTVGSGTSISVSTTVVASDSWLIQVVKDGGGGRTYTASNDLVSVRQDVDGGGLAWGDSNGTVATGSKTGTLSLSGGTTSIASVIISLTPAAEPSVDVSPEVIPMTMAILASTTSIVDIPSVSDTSNSISNSISI